MSKSLLLKLHAFRFSILLEKRLQHGCFPVGKSLRKRILKNAFELTLGSGCLELCLWTVALKTILTQ